MLTAIASHMLALPPWVALLVVFGLPALESSAFIGFIFPGEIALILGGVMAYEGNVSLGAVLAAGIAGAVVGDSVGYAVGRRYGRRLLDGTVGRFTKRAHLDRAETYLAERGGRAVFFGRFTAALRVLIPGLAGMAGLRYRTFLTYNVASGVAWGTMSVLLGYLGGSSWRHVEHVASRIGLAALAVVVVALLGAHLLRRTGAGRLTRLANRLVSSPAVEGTRERFPRTARWIGARLDPTLDTGLALTAALTVAVAATWTFLGITQDVLSREELALLDPRIHGWVVAHRDPSLDAFFEAVTWLGAAAVTVPLLVIGGGLLARRRRSWAPVLDIAVVYGTAVLLHAFVGQVVHRRRPPATDWLSSAGGWAYPSGHTTQAVAAWGILGVIVCAGASPRARVLAGSGAASVAVLVAVSRVYLGVHWATDVLGAAAMSTAVLATWSVASRPPRSHFVTTPNASPTANPRRTVVTLPTYDEAGNVTTVLDRVRAAAPDVDLLVFNDNSPDGTAAHATPSTYADRMHVVVVDDEHRMVELIASYLGDQRVSTIGCFDGPSGLAAARGLDVDAVVLDLMLPGLSGIEVCKQLRREGNDVPILILTARGAVPERVAGLEAGADDYLVKPFALEELHARLRAIRRRLDPDADHRLVVGDITLDPFEQRVWVADTEVTLSRREFAMLASLMESRGHVVSRAQLYDDVWEGEVDIRSNALDVHMSRLRNRLGASNLVTVRTLRGVGYRLEKSTN